MNSPGVGIGIFAINSKLDKFIFGKRVKDDKYCLPGGKLEMYETFEECAARELYEETNINITDLSRFKRVWFSNVINKELEFHWIQLNYLVVLNEDEEKMLNNNEVDKCHGWEWVDFSFIYNNLDKLFIPFIKFLEDTGIKEIKSLLEKTG